MSPLDGTINEIQVEKDVAYAGALAGYKQGILEAYGNRILVTTAPKLIEPREGNFPTISALIRNLLYDPNRDQQPFVFGWLKLAVESLQSGQHRPGQRSQSRPARFWQIAFSKYGYGNSRRTRRKTVSLHERSD